MVMLIDEINNFHFDLIIFNFSKKLFHFTYFL